MKVTEITVNISKKLVTAGIMGSDMASASMKISIEDESEIAEAYAKGWAICYEEVDKQQEELKTKAELKEVADSVNQDIPAGYTPTTNPSISMSTSPSAHADPDPIMTATTPTCPVHGNTVVYRPSGISKKTGKPYAGFYACTARNTDGSYCTEKFK
jgi:hypothetical protein